MKRLQRLSSALFAAQAINNRTRLLLVLLLFGTINMLNAQQINWSSGYPRMDGDPLAIEEGSRTLQMRFIPLNGSVNDANIEVKLPKNVEFVSASTPTSGITITSAATGTLAAGKMVTISVTSNSGSLLQNDEVQFDVEVAAKCGAETGAPFIINVNSGSTLVTGGSRTLSGVNIAIAAFALSSSDGTIDYATQTTTHTVTYNLRTTTAIEASEVIIEFVVDQYSTLSDFMLEATPFTPTETVSGTNKVYRQTLTTTDLGGKLNQVGKTITFTGGSTACGGRVITSKVIYLNSLSCKTETAGATVTMALPELSGTVEMGHVNTTYIDASDNPLTNAQIRMDGMTPTRVRTQFRNIGTLSAHRTIVNVLNRHGSYVYIDTSAIYMQIGSSPIKKIPASQITIVSRLANSVGNGYFGINVGKPININVEILDEISPNETFTVWTPTINGAIYDNGNNPVYSNASATINGFAVDVTRVENLCGALGYVSPPTSRIGFLTAPRYRQVPAMMSFKSNDIKTLTIYVATGSTNQAQTEFFIQLPGWLKIGSSADIKLTEAMDGTGSPIAGTFTDHGSSLYSIMFSGKGALNSHYFHITYTADDCNGGSDQTEQIHYWANQIWPSNDTLKRITQVFQEVKFSCEVEGVELEEYKLVRTSIGLKDNNNDRIPDDGTLAPVDSIRHDAYMVGDSAYIYWKVKIAADAYGYNYLDLPVEAMENRFTIGENANHHLRLQSTDYAVTGGSTPTSVTFTNYGNYKGYLRIYFSGGISAGTTLEVKAPFTVITGGDNIFALKTTPYLSINPIPDPFVENTDKKGKDEEAFQFGTYTMNRVNYVSPVVYPDNSWRTAGGEYVNIFHDNYLPTPWFSKEVRRHEYLDSIVYILPEGYQMQDLSLTTEQGDSHSTAAGNVTKTVPKDPSSTKYRIKFDVAANCYDINHNTSTGLPAGKWILPDDRWRINVTHSIRATKAANPGNSTIIRHAYYKNPTTRVTAVNTRNQTLTYTGHTLYISSTPDNLTAYAAKITNPVITVSNPNNIHLQDTWIYIEGNAINASVKEVGGSATVTVGTGLEGRWINLGTIPAETSRNYDLSYTYTGTSCDYNEITVYSASGFDTAWSPDTSVPIDVDDVDHVARSTTFNVQWALATVTATIGANTTVIPEGSISSYDVYAEFLSTSSVGALKNPEMIFTVPIGQEYQAGMATIEYPVGTSAAIPPAVDAALALALGSTSDKNTERTFTIKLRDLLGEDIFLPGTADPLTTDADRSAKLWMKFKAECNTDFGGIRYTGIISGTSACNTIASNPSPLTLGPVLHTSVMFNYTFDDIIVKTESGIMAFNEIRTQDSLLVTIKKLTGSTPLDAMQSTDILRIVMPKELNVEGNTFKYEGSGSMSSVTGLTGNIISNTVSGNIRILELQVPYFQYNAAVNMGVGAPVTYRMPVEYTHDVYTRVSSPVDSIVCDVMAQAKFGNCPPRQWSTGSGSGNIALLTANYNPYTAYVGESTKIKIISDGFSGSWYEQATGGTAISTTNTLSFIPTYIPTSGDTMFYVSSIIGSDDYGRVPVLVKVDTLPYRNKDASLLISPVFNHNGTYANPVSILFSEKVEYTVKMVNASHKAGTVVLTDTLPAYMKYDGNANPSTGFTKTTIPGTPQRDIVEWEILNVNPFDTVTVSYEATPVSGACASQPLFINQAWLYTSDSLLNFTTKNRTYHQGAGVSITTFSAQLGGKIYNAVEQAVDFRSSPAKGIVVVPEDGYKFAGWSHERYTSLRGETIEAQNGIIHYDTLTVYGNVELRAVFEPVEESFDGEEEVEAKASEAVSDKAWTVEDELFITTTQAGSLIRIYSTEGVLMEQHTVVSLGTTSRKLSRGIYIVTINNDTGHKVRIE